MKPRSAHNSLGRPLERSRRNWDDNIKMYVKYMRSKLGPVAGWREHVRTGQLSSSIEVRGFLDSSVTIRFSLRSPEFRQTLAQTMSLPDQGIWVASEIEDDPQRGENRPAGWRYRRHTQPHWLGKLNNFLHDHNIQFTTVTEKYDHITFPEIFTEHPTARRSYSIQVRQATQPPPVCRVA
jgi:hypothetical protein